MEALSRRVSTSNPTTGSTTPTPLSIGAMLAEEITINPTTVLPSFLELKLVQMASDSGRSSFKFAISTLGNKLSHLLSVRRTSTSTSNTTNTILYFFEKLFGDYTSEICALITHILEKRCLHYYCATLMEYVHGMKRSKIIPGASAAALDTNNNSNNNVAELSTKDKIRSALAVSLLPYVKDKLDNIFQSKVSSSSSSDDDPCCSTTSLFVKLYPFLYCMHKGASLAYHWAYLFGRSIYYTPELHLLGIAVRRITLQDVKVQQQQQHNNTNPKNNSNIPSSSVVIKNLSTTPLKMKVVASLFFVIPWLFHIRNMIRTRREAREVMASQDDGDDNILITTTTHDDNGTLMIFPAPLPPPGCQILLPPAAGVCPICNQTRVNPSASPSGFVFCYKCLIIHVRENGGVCPLNVPCSENQIVRLKF